MDNQETAEVTEEEIMGRLMEVKEQVNQWVQGSEDRLMQLESQVQDVVTLMQPVPDWTQQTYTRLNRLEHMVKSLAMHVSIGRTPVRMPPRAQPTANGVVKKS